MDTAERYEAARARFFNDNPWAVARSEQVDTAIVEACGMTVEEHREQQRKQIFAEAAQSLGIDVHEFVIRLAASSQQQAHEWRIENQKSLAAAVGID
ncbi:hypothetical protein EGJ51_18030 [Pseudomonas fulva]|uniref:Uncharacterized protein n=1 Tax=Pseudomonas parafulva TaxID=157782 RepID=A0AAJ0PEF4_9PSED|nr:MULTISPECIES: DUF6388 family protein [Pseudomonas]KTT16932.1 hypothetical protein NS96R_14425 [Pseudomonas parafulva]RRW59535.1 hypothetical protein EGJ51_18030 [Pseudomonas fulva]